MAKQLYIRLQEPTVELVIVSKPDAANQTSSVVVGFKRYAVDQIKDKFDSFEQAGKDGEETAVTFLSNEIIYIKKAQLDIYEDDVFVETITVEDTRTATPVVDFWETPKECLIVLSGYFLNSTPWKSPLTDAFIKAVLNTDYKEAELKN